MQVQQYDEIKDTNGPYSEIESIIEIGFEEFDLGRNSPKIIVSPNGILAAIFDPNRKFVHLISLPKKQLLESLNLQKYKKSIIKMLFSIDSQYLILQFQIFIVIHDLCIPGSLLRLASCDKNLKIAYITTNQYGYLLTGIIKPYSNQTPLIQIFDLKESVFLWEIRLNIDFISEIKEIICFKNVSKHCVIGHIDDSKIFLLNLATNKYLKIYKYPFSLEFEFWGIKLFSPFACIRTGWQIKIFQLFKWKQIRKISKDTLFYFFDGFLTQKDLILLIDDNYYENGMKFFDEIHCFKMKCFMRPIQSNSFSSIQIQSNPQIFVRQQDDKFEIIKYK